MAISGFPTLTPESQQDSISFKQVQCCGDCPKRDAGTHSYRQNPKLLLIFQKFLIFKTFSREISKQENKLHIIQVLQSCCTSKFSFIVDIFSAKFKVLSFLMETDNETTHLIVCKEPKLIFLNFD